jgi:hypothetical protein
MNSNAPILVYGEGSSSVFLIHELIKRNERVVWVAGSSAPLLPLMPHMKSELALSTLASAADSLAVSYESRIEKGLCHRVFKNKSFKLSNWKKASEQTWIPELSLLGEDECRMEGLNPVLIEERLRASFESHPLITRVERSPVLEFEIFEEGGKIQFAGGMLTEFKRFYFCDDPASLKAFPKLQTIFKNQMKGIKPASRMGALQVVFHHSAPLKQAMSRGLVIPMNRESGETFDRDVLGYFVEPTRSIWTVFLNPSECEENHEIMKKLRKLKQSLNRAFEGPEFLPEGKKEFISTVEREQVRFEDSALYTEGELQTSASNPDFVLFMDGLGQTKAMEQVARHFGLSLPEVQLEEVAGAALDLSDIELPGHLQASDETQAIQPSTLSPESSL